MALDLWDITAGFGDNYQPTTSIAEGTSEEVNLLIRAPDIRQVNEDQSFDVVVNIQSSSDQFATAEQLVRINLVNNNDWNDDDQDGILDEYDLCQFGESGWESTAMTDYDGDGCRDETEDVDDDNDGVEDYLDECPTGVMNPDRVDADFDGCDDILEDTDIDGDLVPKPRRPCPEGANTGIHFQPTTMVMVAETWMKTIMTTMILISMYMMTAPTGVIVGLGRLMTMIQMVVKIMRKI